MKISMLHSAAVSIEEALEALNEKLEEDGILPGDIISMQAEVVDPPVKIHNPKGPLLDGRVALRTFYRSSE